MCLCGCEMLHGKNIAIIGSTSYRDKMLEHKKYIEHFCLEVRIPAFDDHEDLDEIGVCQYNLEIIKWADEVHVFWDQRSVGTVFDFGMCFALNKPIKIEYLQPKTFANLMRKYEKSVPRTIYPSRETS